MKKYIYSTIMSFAMLGMSACSVDDVLMQDLNVIDSNTSTITFSANVKDDLSKTLLAEGNFAFSANESISVFANNSSVMYKFNSQCVQGATSADFAGTMNDDDSKSDAFYAMLPYDESRYHIKDGKINCHLPNVQYAVDGTFDPDANIMFASATKESPNFRFKAICSYVKLVVEEEKYESIVIVGGDDEFLSGDIVIDPATGETTISMGQNSVILKPTEGLRKIAKGTYYIPIFPVTFKNKIKIMTGSEMIREIAVSNVEFARSHCRGIFVEEPIVEKPFVGPVDNATFIVNGVSFEMVGVEGGSFLMGATSEQESDAYENEFPVHQVAVQSFLIGQTEVTDNLWTAVMSDKPSGSNMPIKGISLKQANEFIGKLNQLTGMSFRLPSEAEWEFAARGGLKSKGYKYSGSNNLDEVAWYNGNTTDEWPTYGIHEVGLKLPNELGLYDMSGNVEELCQERYYSYDKNVIISGYYDATDIYRGGCMYSDERGCRNSYRGRSRWRGDQYVTFGLRLVLSQTSVTFNFPNPILAQDENVFVTGELNGVYEIKLSIDGSVVETNVSDRYSFMLPSSVVGPHKATVSVWYSGNLETSKDFIYTVFPDLKMVYVDGGTFQMGGTEEQGDDAEFDEFPVHSVTLSGYSIGQTEVTQALWVAVMGNNPSASFYRGDDLPVHQVSWNDVQEFLQKLNQMTGRNYRLPTEAEWEYAARGGNKSQGYKYSGSNNIDDVAWYISNSDKDIHSVGSKTPNELGLYDMSGNVLEWCQDWYEEYYNSSFQTNPTGPTTGIYRICRGGFYREDPKYSRVSHRWNAIPDSRVLSIGFRLAL